MIFNSTDAECLAMFRMTRAPFSLYATFLEVEALLEKLMGVLLRSKLQCSYMWLVTTRGLGLFTSLLGGPLRQLVESSTKFSMLLVSLGLK
jgi:hypothetical protein